MESESETTFFSRHALFPTPVVERVVHDKFEFFSSLTFLLLAVAASVAIVRSGWDSPSVLYQLNSSNPTENGYTCGCSVPSALQDISAQANSEATTGQVQLKSCYDKSTEVNNVTLVQFNNRTAADVPNLVQPNLTEFFHASSDSGYRVVQEPKEFNLWKGDPNGTLLEICHAIPYQDTIFNFSFNSYQLPIYFDYPQSYMRLVFEYNCSDCSTCSPNQILHPLNISDPWMQIFDWVECSAYAVGVSKEIPCNKATKAYHGRCTLNPKFDISMSKRLKNFLNYVETRVANLTITTPSPDNTSQHGIEMHANSLYYNQSLVESTNVQVDYAFFGVDQSSASWASLIQKYPNVALGSCSQIDQHNRTEICKGTAICNVFKQFGDNGISTPSVSCMDFRHNYTTCSLSANSTGNNDILEDLCGRTPGNESWMTCKSVPAHTISYEFQPSVNTSELDYKFITKYMDNKWNSTYATGVCANLYEDRVRYIDPDNNQLYLLETNCSANGLCHLTGRYNLQNDISPAGTTGTHSKANKSIYTTPQYTCWKMSPQSRLNWAINMIGVLGGWLSTLYAIANFLHGFALPIWHFLHGFALTIWRFLHKFALTIWLFRHGFAFTIWRRFTETRRVSQDTAPVVNISLARLNEATRGEIPGEVITVLLAPLQETTSGEILQGEDVITILPAPLEETTSGETPLPTGEVITVLRAPLQETTSGEIPQPTGEDGITILAAPLEETPSGEIPLSTGDVITILPAPLQETTSGEIPPWNLTQHPSLSRRRPVRDQIQPGPD